MDCCWRNSRGSDYVCLYVWTKRETETDKSEGQLENRERVECLLIQSPHQAAASIRCPLLPARMAACSKTWVAKPLRADSREFSSYSHMRCARCQRAFFWPLFPISSEKGTGSTMHKWATNKPNIPLYPECTCYGKCEKFCQLLTFCRIGNCHRFYTLNDFQRRFVLKNMFEYFHIYYSLK